MIEPKVRDVIIHANKDYYLKVDSRDVIIERSPIPPKNDFLYESLTNTFNKYKHLVKFEDNGISQYPLSSNDKYKEMLKKNPALALLKDKFNCETY